VKSIHKKVTKELYCQFLIAAQTNFTPTDFASHIDNIAHDSITRFLAKTKLTPRVLWEYANPFINKLKGYLICDDTVLDHWYGEKIGLGKWQYSGTHHDVVYGIGLTTLLWTGKNNEHIPFDYRIYAKSDDGKTKNDHFREMLKKAHERGFTPEAVLMDSWYSVSDTLHVINNFGWIFICGIHSNRIVAIGRGKANHFKLKDLDIPETGRILHLQKYGQVKIFRFITQKGKTDYYCTNKLDLTSTDMQKVFARRWEIEEYHRGLKQTVGIAKCQARTKRSQRVHIFCSLLSFLALEKKRLEEGITWYESKRRIISDSLFLYLK
jgi:hypothetical protein